jgi:hypothetical protein
MPLRGTSEDSCGLEFDEKSSRSEVVQNNMLFLPALLQFQLKQLSMDSLEQNEFHLVCKESVRFMSTIKYVHIHSKNPLAHNKRLRKILKLRRTVHKMFDLIKCNEWDKMFVNCSSEESPTKRSKTLMLPK